MNFLQSLLPTIQHFHIIGYWIAFFAATFETTIGIGLFIPGSTIILIMGALAAQGYFDLGDLMWFAIIGAVVGDNINYYIGKKYGNKILKKGFWFFKKEHFEIGKKFFDKHGSKSVFIGRFIPSVKEVAPLIAGTFGMKRWQFFLWNVLGAIGWGLLWILPGYFFSQSLSVAKIWVTRAGMLFGVAILVFIIFYLLERLLIRKGKQLFSFIYSIWKSVKISIVSNKEVKIFVGKHPKFFSFLKRRFSKKYFFGLPFTLLFFALIYTVTLLGGTVEELINSEVIVSIDRRLSNLLFIFRNPILNKFFLWVTVFGRWQVIAIFLFVTIIILYIWQKRTYTIPMLISLSGGAAFTAVGKLLFHRSRPDTALYNEATYSFPSGHATIAMAFYGFIFYILIRNTNIWKKKINRFFLGALIIFLIGFSRLYLDVHYLSDVWGGYLVGLMWLIIAISFSEYLLFDSENKKIKINKNIGKYVITSGLLFCAVVSYIFLAVTFQPEVLQAKNIKQVENIEKVYDIFAYHPDLKYTETLLGEKQEPLSFVILAKNDEEIFNLFEQAGWQKADDVTLRSLVKSIQAAIKKSPYPQAPVTPDFWNSEVHSFAFEKSTTENEINIRHHARFWKAAFITNDGYSVYVGTASFDNGIKWGVTHRINPDIDTEREFLFQDLNATGLLGSVQKEKLVDPTLGKNFTGDVFFTDGEEYTLVVK